MKLTGKAKEDFLKWFDNEYPELSCEYQGNFNMPIISLDALVLSWINTIKYKGVNFYTFVFEFYYKHKTEHQTIIDIQEQTLEKANEIYNNK